MLIAIGKSRAETNWKNKQITWQDFAERLKKPQITPETFAQYKSFTKEKQGEIKDVGGYVGGSIRGGNRVKGSIECRSLITLEGDEDCNDLWELFCLQYDSAAIFHSTHSSTKEHLRARLIIPLSRECFTDEYEAVIRKVADSLGMEYFDYTSFQPERLMFFPSVSKDAEYIFREQKGEPLDVDDVLGSYTNWRDVSQWPLHPEEKKKINSHRDKQENPLDKPGIIGAFCRTYNIHETIEKFLPDIYEATDIPDRYTYKHGSTAAGVVVYDDIFSYSHHATDPAGGILCNAFDLVRISLYSDEDKTTNENTPISKKPSYIKCCELLTKDSKVKKAIIKDKLKEAKNDFTEIDSNEGEDVTKEDWYSKLETDKKGRVIYSTTNNIVLILQNDKKFKDRIRWDCFNHRMLIVSSTYWKEIKQDSDTWIDDNDKANIRHYLEKIYGISGKDKINDALLIVAYKNKFHPVSDYLTGLNWDTQNRLDTLFIDYLGANDNAYTRAVTRKTFVAAVARIFEPGCKFDTMPILAGKQGIGKSTLLKKMGGKWYSNIVGNLHTKESMEQLRGVWLMEMAELASMKKAEVETVKNYLSTTEDRFRPAFGETLAVFLRQNITIGSTNEEEPLTDTTGNRRFWPIELHEYKSTKNVFSISEQDRTQIWAEAVYYYHNKEPLYLNFELNKIAAIVQEQHTEKESFAQLIQSYLNKPIPANWYELTPSEKYSYMQGDGSDFGENKEVQVTERHKISPVEIWLEALNGRKENFTKAKQKDIKNAMKKIKGWEYKVIKIEGIPVRGWMKS